jgi:hypothetical protein
MSRPAIGLLGAPPAAPARHGQRRWPIEPQRRVETLTRLGHAHRGEGDGAAGIRFAVDHL